ncbi:MAG: hemerythrin domain-containing protein [Dehalococcoidales bacterium]|nr:hemerythrin domain-containing protein [Dehalococcoidales bacterium]
MNNDIHKLIQQIIEEHKVTFEKMRNMETVANDVEAISGLEKSKESFMPGRTDQRKGLEALQELLEKVIKGLEKHFKREETALLAAFEKYGDRELATSLHSLLLEHEDLKARFDLSKRHIAELTSGDLSQPVWEAKAHDMRAHLSHTRKLLEAHAAIEQELLKKMEAMIRDKEK